MLPEILLPYKHYSEEVVSGVLDDVILPDDEDSENYPSEKIHASITLLVTLYDSRIDEIIYICSIIYSFRLRITDVTICWKHTQCY